VSVFCDLSQQQAVTCIYCNKKLKAFLRDSAREPLFVGPELALKLKQYRMKFEVALIARQYRHDVDNSMVKKGVWLITGASVGVL